VTDLGSSRSPRFATSRLPQKRLAGQIEVAAAALRELRRAQPNVSLAWIASHMPIKNDADLARYLEGFRRAGLK
jgi:hypothetical protein